MRKHPYDSSKQVLHASGSSWMDFIASSRPSKSHRQTICPMNGRMVNDPRELDTFSASTPVEYRNVSARNSPDSAIRRRASPKSPLHR